MSVLRLGNRVRTKVAVPVKALDRTGWPMEVLRGTITELRSDAVKVRVTDWGSLGRKDLGFDHTFGYDQLERER